ncbi:exported protein of unknown function [Candidatus Nitrosocosmicus arcticus]|uniref:CHRD domain-containing protein n=1 Tax=Candidatus Nitrosocosmicus arcticus TaxID=2035267 RepID=A0A557SWY6_9ARCH|nr:exported protein of unknown function [Candidatus Nitrosocosmicus arcticus]
MKKLIQITLLIIMSVILTSSLFDYSPQNLFAIANAQGSDTGYGTFLSVDEDVPTMYTHAVGIADFASSENSIEYIMKATGKEGSTAGHIHYGIEGEYGPVVVPLFKYDTPQNQISESGAISADNLTGPLEGV